MTLTELDKLFGGEGDVPIGSFEARKVSQFIHEPGDVYELPLTTRYPQVNCIEDPLLTNWHWRRISDAVKRTSPHLRRLANTSRLAHVLFNISLCDEMSIDIL